MKNITIKDKKSTHPTSPRAKKLPVNKSAANMNQTQLFGQLRSRDLNENPYFISQVTEEEETNNDQEIIIKTNNSVNMVNYDTFSGEKVISKNPEPGTSPSFREKTENEDADDVEINTKEDEVSEGSYTSRQVEQM